MAKYVVLIGKRAIKDICAHRKSGDKAIIQRLDTILAELSEHPETGTGQPEKLRYDLSGYWSRRLSLKHRLIYRIDDESVEVLILSAAGHYE